MSNKATGDYGETLACEFLKKQGFKILQRNFRIKGGEIDIIAQQGGDLVFVEVKTRHSIDFGHPTEAVTPWKIRFLVRASQFYLMEKGQLNHPFRLDVVTVDLLDPDDPKLELIKNVTNS